MNIYSVVAPVTGELFTTLFENKKVKISQIISSDEVTPVEYCQQEDEWLVVVRGSATLIIDGEETKLSQGDTFFIPAQLVHQVTKTEQGTLWLTVHISI